MRLICVVALLGAAAPAGSTGLEDGIACRRIADEAARLACYDRVIDALPARSTAGAPGIQAPGAAGPAATPEASFGLEDALARQRAKSADPASRAGVAGKLTAVKALPDGRLLMTLENGQVWAQTDRDELPLRAGDAIEIRRGALGSYRLIGPHKAGAYVKRIR